MHRLTPRLFVHALLGVMLGGVFTGCAVETSNEMQYKAVQNYRLFTIREEEQQDQLLGIREAGFDIIETGDEGTMYYAKGTNHVYLAKQQQVLRLDTTTGKSEVIRQMPFPDIHIGEVMIRDDEQRYALLLTSERRIYDTMVPCGQGMFCTMEVGDLNGEDTQLITIPSAFAYEFSTVWPTQETTPFLVMDRDGTGSEIMHANLDNDGSGFYALVVRQLGETPPVVDVLSNDLLIDRISIETVVEQEGKAYLIFHLRGTEDIYYQFPEEYIVAADKLAMIPSPTLDAMIVQLGEDIYVFRIADHQLTKVATGTRVLEWLSNEEFIYTNYENEYFYNLQHQQNRDIAAKEQCEGVGSIMRKYYPHGERIIVTTEVTKKTYFIDGTRFQDVFCEN